MVCLSVGLSVCHDREACKDGYTDRDAVLVVDSSGPKEPCRLLDGSPDPTWKGTILRGNGWPIVQYREYSPCDAAMQPFVKLL